MGCSISVKNLYKRYPGGVEALRGLSLEIPGARLVAVLGPNGAGKTTLLRAMAGSLRIIRGDVVICGVSARREPLRVRSLVGYVAEKPMLFPELSIVDNIVFAARLHGMAKQAALEAARGLLEELGLWEIKDRRYGQLSKGLKRRADIVAALVHDPEVVILDEPSSGLDPLSSMVVRRHVRRLRDRGKTVVIATHNISEALSLADYVYILVNGGLGLHGDAEYVKKALGGREAVLIVELDIGARDAVRLLAEMGVQAVALDENNVRITGSVSEAIPALVEVVKRLGMGIRNIVVKELTWEEAFARLVYAGRRGGSTECGCCPTGGE